MRILKVVQAYYPFQEKGGPIVKVRALARALTRRGHDVSVLTADLGLASYDDVDMRIERCRFGWRANHDGIEIIYLPTAARYRAITVNPRVLEFFRSPLGRLILFTFTVSMTCSARRSAFLPPSSDPYVIEPMGMNRPIDRNIQMKRLWHSIVGDVFMQYAAKIIATSQLEERELIEDNVSLAEN